MLSSIVSVIYAGPLSYLFRKQNHISKGTPLCIILNDKLKKLLYCDMLFGTDPYICYQEHLLIVCELLKANLYEFHKFNRESGGEVYFTMPRLQVCCMAISIKILYHR